MTARVDIVMQLSLKNVNYILPCDAFHRYWKELFGFVWLTIGRFA